MTKHYVITIETSQPTDIDVADRWVEDLKTWHGAVGDGPGGHLVVTLTLPAESLAQAVATGLALVERHATPVAVQALSEELQDAREGWTPVPEMVSVSEAAQMLSVSRQRVLQMIDEGKLPGTKVGRSYTVPRTAVVALTS